MYQLEDYEHFSLKLFEMAKCYAVVTTIDIDEWSVTFSIDFDDGDQQVHQLFIEKHDDEQCWIHSMTTEDSYTLFLKEMATSAFSELQVCLKK